MRLPCIVAGLVLTAALSPAAKLIREEITDLTTHEVSSQEILIDATRVRVSLAGQTLIFLSEGTPRLLIVYKLQNTYQELDQQAIEFMLGAEQRFLKQLEQSRKTITPQQRAEIETSAKAAMPPAMVEKVLKVLNGGTAPLAADEHPVPAFAVRERETVNGFDCVNYEGSLAGARVRDVCSAAPPTLKLTDVDLQAFKRMSDFMQPLFDSSSMVGNAGGMLSSGFPGLPVRETPYYNGKSTVRLEVKSVVDVTASDADFSVGTAKKMVQK